MKIKSNEEKLVGAWIVVGEKVVEDEVCRRIDWLTKNYLVKVSSDASGCMSARPRE